MRRLLLLLLIVPLEAVAEFGGHLKYQPRISDYRSNDLAAAYGEDPALDQTIDLRLTAEGRSGGWEGAIHYELLALGGDSVAAWRQLAASSLPSAASGLPNDSRRLLDLTDQIESGSRVNAVQRIDRLSLGYSTPAWVARVGRQAVSWGNGLTFQALDFINPFPPLAINKDYKSGDDMLYLQRLFESGDDLQLIALPRRDPLSGNIEADESTLGVKYHLMESEGDLLLAYHYGEPQLGFGLARELGEAVWRFDTNLSRGSDGEWLANLVTNIDYSWVWFEHNLYGYIEYFHSGAGEGSESGYLQPNSELLLRLARGELYGLGRDYLATGLDIELTPLLHLRPTLLTNLNDSSGVAQLSFSYDWTQSLQLLGGANLPWGERGSEYGGVPVATTPCYQTPGRSLYLQLGWFF